MNKRILEIIKNEFNKDEQAPVIKELASITIKQTMNSKKNLSKTLYAILKLSNGDFKEVTRLVKSARIDFRDIIYWHQIETSKNKDKENNPILTKKTRYIIED